MAYAVQPQSPAPIRRVNTARYVPMSGFGADTSRTSTTAVMDAPGVGTYAAWALVATLVGASFYVLGKEIYEMR